MLFIFICKLFSDIGERKKEVFLGMLVRYLEIPSRIQKYKF